MHAVPDRFGSDLRTKFLAVEWVPRWLVCATFSVVRDFAMKAPLRAKINGHWERGDSEGG